MAPNAQVAGQSLLVEAMVDATAQVGGQALLVDAMVDATAQVGGVVLLVEAIIAPPGSPLLLAHHHYAGVRGIL